MRANNADQKAISLAGQSQSYEFASKGLFFQNIRENLKNQNEKKTTYSN